MERKVSLLAHKELKEKRSKLIEVQGNASDQVMSGLSFKSDW